MPKYYCDYCDTFLTHDSPSVRKTHCNGRKHKENVRFYYQKWLEEQAQNLIDVTTAAFKANKALVPPAFGMKTTPGVTPSLIPPALPPGVRFPAGTPAPPLPIPGRLPLLPNVQPVPGAVVPPVPGAVVPPVPGTVVPPVPGTVVPPVPGAVVPPVPGTVVPPIMSMPQPGMMPPMRGITNQAGTNITSVSGSAVQPPPLIPGQSGVPPHAFPIPPQMPRPPVKL